MKILNFGSLNIDYVYSVPHIVREGETIASITRNVFPGGKGLNQAVAVSLALEKNPEISVYLAGGIGKEDGDFLLKALEAFSLNLDFLFSYDESTGHTCIQVDNSGKNSIIYYAGANGLQSKKVIDKVLDNFSKGDYLILQNEINNVDYLIKIASEKGLIVFFNPSPFTEEIFSYPLSLVDYFFVNETESRLLINSKVEMSDEETLEVLKERFPKSNIVLTRGQKGVLFSHNGKTTSHGIYQTKVLDTTAAGDSFTGYFIASLAQGADDKEILATASKAGAIAVSREGALPSIPHYYEVKNCMFPYKS